MFSKCQFWIDAFEKENKKTEPPRFEKAVLKINAAEVVPIQSGFVFVSINCNFMILKLQFAPVWIPRWHFENVEWQTVIAV